jgi:hypothetical protein
MRTGLIQIFIATAFIYFLTITPANSQEIVTGIKFGYNSSQFTGSAIPDVDHARMPGINFGGIFVKTFRNFDLQFETMISSKGFRIKSIGDTYISNLLIYIDLPVMIKKSIFSNKNFRVFLTGGTSAMFNILSMNLVSELEGIRKFDSGILVGLGTQFSRISFEIRVTPSIINFDRVEPKKYNQVISAGLSFYFKEPQK